MGTPNNQAAIRVLVALFAVFFIFMAAIPFLLYLALHLVVVFYIWYAVVLAIIGTVLIAWLLEDHDSKPPTIRKVGRII